MKNILLTTTAMIAFAGAAAADGHASITWGGAATAGVAREGGSAAGGNISFEAFNAITGIEGSIYEVDDQDDMDALLEAILAGTDDGYADVAALRAALNGTRANIALDESLSAADKKSATTRIDASLATIDAVYGAAAVDTGEWDTYAEVNLTATGSVDLGNGVTLSGAVSVDGGTGYDFADDDGFDAAKTNGVALDYITVDGGAMGALTFDKNDIAHLVDGDDDAAGDIKYTNAFGNATVAFVMDISTDSDDAPSKASWALTDDDCAADGGTVAIDLGEDELCYTKAVAADVQWSVKLGYTVSDSMSVYAAFDEGQGNAFGGSYSMNGMTVSVDSKLEALEAELKADRSNTIAGSYTVAGFTAGASYNTIKDGNQWGVNAAYAVDGMSVAYNTNEGEEWTATASYALNDLASVNAAVNYTEDAYVGVSFKF